MKCSGSLFKNAAVYTIANVLNAAIPFLLLPILTRVLAPSDYGVIGMFQATLGVVGAFTGLSVHGAVSVRFVDREKIDFPRYVMSCIWVLMLSTLATFLIVAAFLSFLSDFTSVPAFWLLMSVVVSCCNFLIQIRMGIWLMASMPKLYGIFQVSQSALNMGLSLLFVLLLKQDFEGRLRGQSLALVLFAIVALLSLVRDKWVSLKPSWTYVREALAFGVPLVPHMIGIFLIGVADRFIIKQKLGLEQAGIYLVAAQLAMGMGVIAEAFNNAFVPWLYRNLKDGSPQRKAEVVKGTWLYFLVALAIAVAVAITGPWIVLLVAGPKYAQAVGALAFLAFGQAFSGMYLMVTNYIFYVRQTRCLAWVTLLSGGFGISLTWHLVPVYGITGAGFSFAATMLIRFLLTWVLAQRVCRMPWFSFEVPQREKLAVEQPGSTK